MSRITQTTTAQLDRHALQKLADTVTTREELRLTVKKLVDDIKELDVEIKAMVDESGETDDEGRPMIDISDVSDTHQAIKLIEARSASSIKKELLLKHGVKLSVIALCTKKGTKYSYPLLVAKPATVPPARPGRSSRKRS